MFHTFNPLKFSAFLMGLTSVVVVKEESADHSLHPTTIPAGTEGYIHYVKEESV